MKKISKHETIIIKELFKSSAGELEPFTLYRRLRTSITGLKNSVNGLIKLGFVEEKGTKIKITQEGKNWLLAPHNKHILNGSRPWREVPKEFLVNNIPPGSFYIPSISRLDKKAFK